MPFKVLFLLVIVITTSSCNDNYSKKQSTNNHHTQQYQWHEADGPTSNVTKVYGGYTAGCIDGATKLPKKGVGYIAATHKNNRLYGHPNLINVVEKLAQKMYNEHGLTLLISDLGQARGGPAPIKTSAHRSHQNGLDVDIWYRSLNKNNLNEENIYPETVLSESKDSLNKKSWGESNLKMLEYTAQYDEVQRVLVNPYVKKAMCKEYGDTNWINKIRPWWGHHKHFHIRLKCPVNDRSCKKQEPVPSNEDTCGAALNWWFSNEAIEMGKAKSETKRTYPNLPRQCHEVWNYSKKHLSSK